MTLNCILKVECNCVNRRKSNSNKNQFQAQLSLDQSAYVHKEGKVLGSWIVLELESDTALGLPLCSLFISIHSPSNHCIPLPAILHFLLLFIFTQLSAVNMEDGKDQASGKKKSIVVGPWGGNGGSSWDDGSYNGVREISLVYDRCIDSIRVVYDKNGKPVSAEKHGGVGGNRTAEIKLQFPEEVLTTVSGHYCPVVHGGSPVIRSLTFKTNRRTFGPFGVEEGTPFTFPMDGGLIVGFKGRSGWYLDAIGFRLSRAQTAKLFQRVQKQLQKLASSVSRSASKDE